MAAYDLPPLDMLRRAFEVDAHGQLRWRSFPDPADHRSHGSLATAHRFAGKLAGAKTAGGARRVSFRGRTFDCSRIARAILTGDASGRSISLAELGADRAACPIEREG